MEWLDPLFQAFKFAAERPEAIIPFGLFCILLAFLLVPHPDGGKISWNFLVVAGVILILTLSGGAAAYYGRMERKAVDAIVAVSSSAGSQVLTPTNPTGVDGRTDLSVLGCPSAANIDEAARVARALNKKGSWGRIRYGALSADLSHVAFANRITVVTDAGQAEERELPRLKNDLLSLGFEGNDIAGINNPGAASRWYVSLVVCEGGNPRAS